MERRKAERKNANIKCHLVSRSINFSGIIENISENGVYVSIHPSQTGDAVPDDMFFIVRCTDSFNREIDIQCKVVRSVRRNVSGEVNTVGMEIVSHPPEYKEFLKFLR